MIDINLPAIVEFERPAGGAQAIAEAAKLLSEAKFPVILSGAGVVLGNAIPECVALAEKLDAPVCNNYQHNDSFPGSHRLAVGPLGYNGSKAAMELIAKADVVLALGTRLNPFSTLPGYGIDYWPKTAKIIQVDINADRIGLTKPVTVGICGDAKLVAQSILAQLSPTAGDAGREERKALIHTTKSTWLQALSSMDHEDDDPGTTWNADARKRDADRMSPRQAWRAIQAGLPKDAIISSDIGNNCAIGNAYPTFEKGRKYLAPGLFGPCGYGFPSIIGAKIGNPDTPCVGFAGDGAFGISMSEMSSIGREEWPGITMVIFRNYQWGAEKRNSILWYDDNFVGTELDPHLSYAKVAEGCGLKGVMVKTQAELTEALRAVLRGAEEARDDLHRGHPQSGTGRAVPPRRHEEAGGRGRHQARGHAPAAESRDRSGPTMTVRSEIARCDPQTPRRWSTNWCGAAARRRRSSPTPTRRAPTRRSPRSPGRSTSPTHAKELAELAVADTKLGNVPDKITKKQRKTFGTLRDLLRVKSVGIIEEDKKRGIVKYAKPVGVVCAITPSTNPGATPVNKAMMAIKGRNAIIIAASPAGLKTTHAHGRVDARGAEENRRAGRPGADPAAAGLQGHDAGADAGGRSGGRHRLAGQCAARLFQRHAGDRRRHRQRAGDHRRDRRSRRRGQENLRLEDFRQFDVVLVGKFRGHRRRGLRQGDRRARARRRLYGHRRPRRRSIQARAVAGRQAVAAR